MDTICPSCRREPCAEVKYNRSCGLWYVVYVDTNTVTYRGRYQGVWGDGGEMVLYLTKYLRRDGKWHPSAFDKDYQEGYFDTQGEAAYALEKAGKP